MVMGIHGEGDVHGGACLAWGRAWGQGACMAGGHVW